MVPMTVTFYCQFNIFLKCFSNADLWKLFDKEQLVNSCLGDVLGENGWKFELGYSNIILMNFPIGCASNFVTPPTSPTPPPPELQKCLDIVPSSLCPHPVSKWCPHKNAERKTWILFSCLNLCLYLDGLIHLTFFADIWPKGTKQLVVHNCNNIRIDCARPMSSKSTIISIQQRPRQQRNFCGHKHDRLYMEDESPPNRPFSRSTASTTTTQLLWPQARSIVYGRPISNYLDLDQQRYFGHDCIDRCRCLLLTSYDDFCQNVVECCRKIILKQIYFILFYKGYSIFHWGEG